MKISKMNRTAVNMSAAIFSYTLPVLVSFFLSPFIVENIGVEGNGYITLGNNFVTYASMLTIALTSMAGRFITIEFEKGNYEKANEYYNSIVVGSGVICLFILIVSIALIVFLEKLIEIPNELVIDVKILFALLLFNFIVSVFSGIFSVSTFATNKLYLSNMRNAEGTLIRAVVLLVLYSLFAPKLYYVGFAATVITLYLMFFNLYYRHSLLKEITLKKVYVKFQCIVEVVSSGIWNTITKLGQILLSGLDVLIANIFINPTAMGVLSISKTVPSAILGLVGAMASVFVPNLTIDFAHGDMNEVTKRTKQSMKIMSTFVNMPIVVMTVNADQFYKLWQPSQDSKQLQILTVLSLVCLIVSGGVNIIYNIFTVVNKLKLNSILIIVSGFVSTGVVFVLLKTTTLGLYAIAATSEIVGLVRILGFVVPYGAVCLKQKWYTFYKEALIPLIPSAIAIIIGYQIKSVVVVNSWITYILFSVVLAIIVLMFNLVIILNKSDRIELMHIIAKKVKKNA